MKKTKNFILTMLLTLPILLSAQQTVHIGDILCTDGSTIRVNEFPSSGKTAMGVVYHIDNSGQSGLAVNLHDDEVNTPFGGYGDDFPLTDIEESRKAIYDFGGYHNTEILRSLGNAYSYPAPWSVDFENDWYLPAAGELRLLYNQILTVNNSLVAIGATPLYEDTDNYWSSTERTPFHMHDMARNGNLGNYPKTPCNNAWVGVRSIRSFSAESSTFPIGEVIVNDDGSKGIVFYVNHDEKAYWMVALHDAPSMHPWGDHTDLPLPNQQPEILFNLLNDNNGHSNTSILRHYQNNNSYAAFQVDFENGWYLPSVGQLSKLYGVLSLVEDSIIFHEGNLLRSEPYWTSTESDEDMAWCVDYGSPGQYGGFSIKTDKTTHAHIRAIHDFDPNALQPFVGEIITPETICAGSSLELQAPSTQHATRQGWQISANEDFTNCQTYNGEELDESFDGWYLRYYASNHLGTAYSNTVQISVLSVSMTSFDISSCNSYTWDGETYTASGDYEQIFNAQNGCDSIVTLHLTITPSVSYDFMISTCGSFIWNGTEYNESGDYEQTFTSSTGCDSIVTMHLTIEPAINLELMVNACDSYIWNGTEYFESGDFIRTFTTPHGCDSIVTLHLTLNPSVSYDFMISTCDSYIWNGTEYFESGDYEQTLTSSTGCDSIVAMHLSIETFDEMQAIEGDTEIDSYLTPNSVFVQSGFMSGSIYQWSIEPAEAGSIIGSGNTVIVNWSPEFKGNATLTVNVSNACGEGNNAITVNVKNTFDVSENSINAKLYPNPTSGDINIEVPGMQHITITNTLGQNIVDMELDADTSSIDMAQFGTGMYLIRIQTSNGSCTKRFWVE